MDSIPLPNLLVKLEEMNAVAVCLKIFITSFKVLEMAIYFSFVFLISQSCPESRLDGPKCKVCREEVLLS